MTSRSLHTYVGQLHAAYMNARAPFALLLADGTMVYENRAASEFGKLVFGRPMSGHSLAELVTAGHPVAVDWMARVQRCSQTGQAQTWRASYPTVTDPVTVTYRDCTLTPYIDDAGHIAGFLGEMCDITELVEQQLELQQREALLVGILQTAQDAVISVSPDDEVVRWNAAAERLFGWTAAQATGEPLHQLIVPPAERRGGRGSLACLGCVRAGQLVTERVETVAVDRQGDAIPVEIAASVIELDGSAPHYTTFIRDIRERRNAQYQLNARLKQLETVAYVTTHDLRGGADQARYDAEELAEIIEELPADLVDEYDLREIVGNLAAATQQQVSLLDGVDALVGLWESNHIETERFDGTAYLTRQIGLIDQFTGEDIVVDALGDIDANKGMFWTVIFNLIKNALKYNDKPDRQVRIFRTGNSLHIQDNGNGIPEDKFDQVTRVFQRLDNTKPGKGLGLSICEAMLGRHGWIMTIRSQVGHGSTFTIAM